MLAASWELRVFLVDTLGEALKPATLDTEAAAQRWALAGHGLQDPSRPFARFPSSLRSHSVTAFEGYLWLRRRGGIWASQAEIQPQSH